MNKSGAVTSLLAISLAGFLGLSATGALALPGDRDLPVDVRADRSQGNLASNRMEYMGDVRIEQGTLVIVGERVVILRDENDEIRRMEAFGEPESPARVVDQLEAGDAPTRMQGQTIVYDAEQSFMEARENGWLLQGPNQVNAHYIRHNLEAETFESSVEAPDGSRGVRVTMCLTPERDAEESADVDTADRPTPCEELR